MKPKTHQKCREQTCCCCGAFAKNGPISKKLQGRVKKWAKPEWDPDILSHPVGLCESCRVGLQECERVNSNIPPNRQGQKIKWDSFKLQDISLPSRGQPTEKCMCDICTARRFRVGDPGCKPCNLKNKMVSPNCKIDELSEVTSSLQSRCSKCLQITGKGISHPCTDVNKKKNLIKLVEEMGEVESEQVAAAVIKKVAKNKKKKTQ